MLLGITNGAVGKHLYNATVGAVNGDIRIAVAIAFANKCCAVVIVPDDTGIGRCPVNDPVGDS